MKHLLWYLCFSLCFLVGCNQTTSNAQNGRSTENVTKESGITPKWGSRYYKAHNGKIEAIEHIWLRHNYNSTYNNVSRFAKEYSTRIDIKKLIVDALRKARDEDIQNESDGGKTVTVTMDKLMGTSQRGKPTYKIRIHLDKNNSVETAYPY